MKIVYLSLSSIPSNTANSVHVMKMCQAFVRCGHEITLIAPDYPAVRNNEIKDIFSYYGVQNCFKIIKLKTGTSKATIFTYPFQCLKFVRENKPDLVYGRSLKECAFVSYIQVPILFEAHAPLHNSSFLERFLFKRMISKKNFKKLVVISEALKMYYLDIIDFDLIITAHDGADEVADFNAIPDKHCENNTLKVGYIGHLYEGRGIDTIIKIAQRINDVQFHIIGGRPEDVRHWRGINTSQNLFFHGFVPPADTVKYRNYCDILLAPYPDKVLLVNGKTDTGAYMSPLKIFEYMSSRKAIVASDLAVLREVLDENNSILVKSEDIDAWCNAINKLRKPETRKLIAENAHNDFKKKLHMESQV